LNFLQDSFDVLQHIVVPEAQNTIAVCIDLTCAPRIYQHRVDPNVPDVQAPRHGRRRIPPVRSGSRGVVEEKRPAAPGVFLMRCV
jgi:hypothetical protein